MAGEARPDLVPELADRPVSPDTLNFVEAPFERVVDPNQLNNMAPGEPQQIIWQGYCAQFNRQCLVNLRS
jgi:hypothetical protein